MSSKKSILFDLDGTLVESLSLFYQAVDESLMIYGSRLDKAYFSRWHAERHSWDRLLTHHAIEKSNAKKVETCSNSRFIELLKTKAVWKEGAEDLLQYLKTNTIKTAIITTSFRNFIESIESKLNLSAYISLIISSEDVEGKTKPDPYGLLLAADKLEVNPYNCIYVGDQPFDMLAANRAGMQSWFVGEKNMKVNSSYVFGSLHEVLSKIKSES